MLGDKKLREKSSVFRRCLKISSEEAERAVDGILFNFSLDKTATTSVHRIGHKRRANKLCQYLAILTVLKNVHWAVKMCNNLFIKYRMHHTVTLSLHYRVKYEFSKITTIRINTCGKTYLLKQISTNFCM